MLTKINLNPKCNPELSNLPFLKEGEKEGTPDIIKHTI